MAQRVWNWVKSHPYLSSAAAAGGLYAAYTYIDARAYATILSVLVICLLPPHSHCVYFLVFDVNASLRSVFSYPKQFKDLGTSKPLLLNSAFILHAF
jgi:hypothetical protein